MLADGAQLLHLLPRVLDALSRLASFVLQPLPKRLLVLLAEPLVDEGAVRALLVLRARVELSQHALDLLVEDGRLLVPLLLREPFSAASRHGDATRRARRKAPVVCSQYWYSRNPILVTKYYAHFTANFTAVTEPLRNPGGRYLIRKEFFCLPSNPDTDILL